jgi:hypothetical protein
MTDDSTQRDSQPSTPSRHGEERDASPASLPWVEETVEELFGAVGAGAGVGSQRR